MFKDKFNNSKVIDDQKYLWSIERFDDIDIYSKGGMWIENEYFTANLVSKRFTDLFLGLENKLSDPDLILYLKNLTNSIYGHFAFIIDSPQFILAVVDKIRSRPIFYSKNIQTLMVSCSAHAIQSTLNLVDMEETSAVEFLMAGYVAKEKTLFRHLRQLRAGEFLFFDKRDSRFFIERYYSYYPQQIDQREEDELLEVHHYLIKNVFSKMVETLNGRKVWIPLSGGLDSRLVLGALLEAKYDNVGTFTYGIPQLWEVKWAKKFAEHAGVEWHYIEYDRKKLSTVYSKNERAKYFEFASGLSSVPFFTELFALSELRKKKYLDHESIIINGQTGDFISGGHLPKMLESIHNDCISFESVVQLLIEKHYSLWTNLKTPENIKIIKQNILDSIGRFVSERITKDEVGQLYELYEWQERQSKYVVNGQRMYEWFGFEWRLPLWSDELMYFWQNIPWQLKISQNLYKKYLLRFNPGDLFNLKMPKPEIYFPMVFRPFYTFLLAAAKFVKVDPRLFLRKYVDYFWVYSPFYPQKNYFEYLKDSSFHRNHASYYAREVLSLLSSRQ